MKQSTFKTLWVLLLAVALLAALTLFASAETYNGSFGDNLTWVFDTQTGVLTISGEGEMENFSSASERPWNDYAAQIVAAVVQDGVTSIGNSAFLLCTGLTTVDIPDSVTSIGTSAFCNCTGLTTVDIPDSVTSIGTSAFCNCTGLTSVDIPDSVTEIGEIAFYGCNNISELSLGDGIETMGNQSFPTTESFKKLTVGSFVNSSLFENVLDSGVEEIVIRDGVESLKEKALCSCFGLKKITLPASITSIGEDAFSWCSNLTGVYISDLEAWCGIRFSNEYANPLRYAKKLYLNNELITELVIPNSVTSIGAYAFERCTSLTSVTISAGVTEIGDSAFRNCTGLTAVEIPNSVNTIGNNAIYNCYSLTSVTIPASVTSIGDSAFDFCEGLKEVRFFGKGVSVGSSAFYGCDRLTAVYISDVGAWASSDFANWSANPLYYARKLYVNDTLLEGDLRIPDGTASIGARAFEYCRDLNNIFLPESITKIGEGAFYSDSIWGEFYFKGSKEAWDAVEKSDDWHRTVHYNTDSAEGHYGAGEITTPPTCVSYGERTYTCPCGYSYTESVDIDRNAHKYGTGYVVAPTCTEDGYTEYYCIHCSHHYRDTPVPALGHEEPDLFGYCPRCNEKIQKVTPQFFLKKIEFASKFEKTMRLIILILEAITPFLSTVKQ